MRLPSPGRRRAPASGQALVLFVLTLSVLLALVGFAIDGLRVYIALTQAQRAAQAAAQAGVVDLPQHADTAMIDAVAAAAMNGIAASDVTVVVLSSAPPVLQVRVHFHVALTIGSVLSPTPVDNVAVAAATLLPPVTFGTGGSSYGDTGPAAALVGPNGDYDTGDPYSVLCVAPTDCSVADHEQIPAGFGGLATQATFAPFPTGASYLITLPAGATNDSVWVRTAIRQDPTAVSYSLFALPQLYNRRADVPQAAIWPYSYPGYGLGPVTWPQPPLTTTQILDTETMPSSPATWVKLPQEIAAPATLPGFFRLTVEAIAGSATHTYAVRVCHDTVMGPDCAPAGVTLAPWNFVTMSLRLPGTTPLGVIPAAYAGRELQIGLFLPAAISEDATLVVQPPGGQGIAPIPVALTPASGAAWTHFVITLPPGYSGGLWNLSWSLPRGTVSGVITVKAALVGSPVQLIPAA